MEEAPKEIEETGTELAPEDKGVCYPHLNLRELALIICGAVEALSATHPNAEPNQIAIMSLQILGFRPKPLGLRRVEPHQSFVTRRMKEIVKFLREAERDSEVKSKIITKEN